MISVNRTCDMEPENKTLVIHMGSISQTNWDFFSVSFRKKKQKGENIYVAIDVAMKREKEKIKF